MKNIPKKIFLQIGDEDLPENFDDLYEVFWSSERIYGNDIEYAIVPHDERNMNAPNSHHIDFAIYLTGHDKESIEQMYSDWRKYYGL